MHVQLTPLSFTSSSNMVPTGGVRIDQNKLNQLHNEVTKMTKGYTVEKLERVFSALMGVVGKHSSVSDRSHLPDELQDKLNTLKETRR